MTVEIPALLAERESLSLVEVAGYSVTCIASNIREKNRIDWSGMQVVEGVGREGNLVLGQVISVGARKEMEYLQGEESINLPLLSGNYIVGVLANRHSNTSEHGKVPENGESSEKSLFILLIL